MQWLKLTPDYRPELETEYRDARSSEQVRIAEDLVSLAEFLELFLGGFISRVFIRVIFHREAAVGFFYAVGGLLAGDLQDFVVVALGSQFGKSNQ